MKLELSDGVGPTLAGVASTVEGSRRHRRRTTGVTALYGVEALPCFPVCGVGPVELDVNGNEY
jgi:hypothetical protein